MLLLLIKLLRLLVFIYLLPSVLGSGSFYKQCLTTHNKLREYHGAPPLEYDVNVQEYAQSYASTLAATNKFQHSDGKYGENIHMLFGNRVSAQLAVHEWYKEIKFYNFDKPEFNTATNHFTQLVWKSSKRLGCAYAKSSDGKVYIVGNYDPKGNVLGDFEDNVAPRYSSATVIQISIQTAAFTLNTLVLFKYSTLP